jgi:hypothetical protein
MSSSWPAEAASRVKLLTPKAFLSDSTQCVLRYDEANRLLAIVCVSSSEGTVLDQIDVDDMIGAQVHFTLSEGATATSSVMNNLERASNEPPSDLLVDRQGSAVLTIFTYPRKDPSQNSFLTSCGITAYRPKTPNPSYTRPTDLSKMGQRSAHPREFIVAPAEDMQDLTTLVVSLRMLATGGRVERPPTYLILVNPRSGPKRNGETLAKTIVQPMLAQSGVQSDICVTSYAKHATERVKNKLLEAKSDININSDEKDLAQYDGLILMGGDGIIHEALNGIMTRDDAAQLLQSKIKIGIVGCGTSNGFATSITHHSRERYGPIDETYLICKGLVVPTDLSSYATTSHSYTSFLTFSWGIIADVDIESERIHFLGESRFDLWAVVRVLFLRRYRARLSYLSSATPIANLPALSEPVPADWHVIEDDFFLFWASQVTHAAVSFPCRVFSCRLHEILRSTFSHSYSPFLCQLDEHVPIPQE